MTYQESHFPSNQADFSLILGMVAFSPSSPLPKALSCLPCDVCPIFCHSGVIYEHGGAVSRSLAVCHSQCSAHPQDVTSGTPGSALGFNYGCCSAWLPERSSVLSQLHTPTAVPSRSTGTNSQPCPS